MRPRPHLPLFPLKSDGSPPLDGPHPRPSNHFGPWAKTRRRHHGSLGGHSHGDAEESEKQLYSPDRSPASMPRCSLHAGPANCRKAPTQGGANSSGSRQSSGKISGEEPSWLPYRPVESVSTAEEDGAKFDPPPGRREGVPNHSHPQGGSLLNGRVDGLVEPPSSQR